FLQACLRQVEMFKPPPHLLTCQWLITEFGHGRAYSFRVVYGIDETTVVQDFTKVIGLCRGLIAVVDLLEDGSVHREIGTNTMKITSFIPLGTLARRDYICFAS